MTNPQHPHPTSGQQAGLPHSSQPGQPYDPQHAPYGYTQQPGAHGHDPQHPSGAGYAAGPAPAYPQHGGQPPHPGQQKAHKRKKPLWKRWWFWLLAILALFIIIAAAGGGGESTEEAGADSGSADESGTGASGEEESAGEDEEAADGDEEAAEYGIGDTVATGDWEVTVNEVAAGSTELGDQYLSTTAQGQFILVEMSVANTGSDPSFFYEGDVSLQDADGNTYSPDSEAGIYASTDSQSMLLDEINPGNTASGVIVYDVPADVSPNVLEFQGGIFDEPATVALD